MKAVGLLLIVGGIGLAAWLIATRLSSDAVGMALGVVFGVLAAVPAMLAVAGTAGGSYYDGLRDGRAAAADQVRLLQVELQLSQQRLDATRRAQDRWIDVETWIALETRRP